MPNDSKLEESFGVPANPQPVEVEIIPPNVELGKLTQINPQEDLRKDIDFARDKMRNLIEQSFESFEVLKDVAEQSQTAKGFETMAMMIKSLVEANRELVGLHRNLPSEQASQGPGAKTNQPDVVNNIVFNGTTAELQQLLKKNRG